MEQRIVKSEFAPFFENAPAECFSMKIGGTVYDVTTHWNAEGRQSVLAQFKELLLSYRTMETDI